MPRTCRSWPIRHTHVHVLAVAQSYNNGLRWVPNPASAQTYPTRKMQHYSFGKWNMFVLLIVCVFLLFVMQDLESCKTPERSNRFSKAIWPSAKVANFPKHSLPYSSLYEFLFRNFDNRNLQLCVLRRWHFFKYGFPYNSIQNRIVFPSCGSCCVWNLQK